MPTISNKAIQLDVKAYIVDNNIRRSVLSTRAVALATDANIIQNTLVLGPNDSSVLPVTASNNFTFIKTDRPIKITMTNSSGSFVINTSNIFAISDNITGLLLENLSTMVSAEVFVIQA